MYNLRLRIRKIIQPWNWGVNHKFHGSIFSCIHKTDIVHTDIVHTDIVHTFKNIYPR